MVMLSLQMRKLSEALLAYSIECLKTTKRSDHEPYRKHLNKPTASICENCPLLHEQSNGPEQLFEFPEASNVLFPGLTDRQHEILRMVLSGMPSKNIAADLHISQRTVENHRASIMKRTGAKSLPELVYLAISVNLPESNSDLHALKL
jgi:DNA-binding CsgD family transcriptional regulator